MKKIKLDVLGLSRKGQDFQQAYALVLSEENGPRRLPIVIGYTEAQAIAIALENIPLDRPLTHDLFITFLNKMNVAIKEVVIVKLEKNIFYSEIVFLKDNKEYRLDSRTSDAITMAIKSKAPIYINEEILDRVGIDITKESKAPVDKSKTSSKTEETLDKMSIDQLKIMLQKSIEDEDYEKAAQIRDIIKKKEN